MSWPHLIEKSRPSLINSSWGPFYLNLTGDTSSAEGTKFRKYHVSHFLSDLFPTGRVIPRQSALPSGWAILPRYPSARTYENSDYQCTQRLN